jgi:hypothetical protein
VSGQVQIAQRGRPLGSPFSVWFHFRLVPFLAAHLVKLLRATLRVERQGLEAVQELVARDQRFILSFWHRRLVMMPLAYPFHRRNAEGKRRGVAILSSDSKDGERSAATWRWFGIHAVRGTAGDKGAQALVKMIQAVREGWDLGITVDGPKGPRQKAKAGVLAVSRKTGAWIVPVCVAYSRAWTLRTWDAMPVPKPFSRCTVRFGTPYRVEPDARDDAALSAALEGELNAMEQWAEDRHG